MSIAVPPDSRFFLKMGRYSRTQPPQLRIRDCPAVPSLRGHTKGISLALRLLSAILPPDLTFLSPAKDKGGIAENTPPKSNRKGVPDHALIPGRLKGGVLVSDSRTKTSPNRTPNSSDCPEGELNDDGTCLNKFLTDPDKKTFRATWLTP